MTVMAKVVETHGKYSIYLIKFNHSIVESDENDDLSSENDDLSSDNKETANAAWADSIAKILKTNKPKGKKTLVLSKAKKLTDVKKTKVKLAGFEVATVDGEFKEEKISDDETSDEDQPRKVDYFLLLLSILILFL